MTYNIVDNNIDWQMKSCYNKVEQKRIHGIETLQLAVNNQLRSDIFSVEVIAVKFIISFLIYTPEFKEFMTQISKMLKSQTPSLELKL